MYGVKLMAALFMGGICLLAADSRDARETFRLLNQGKMLTDSDADKLETKVSRKPKDEDSRILLLTYYSSRPAGEDIRRIKTARARHIFWLIENDPREGLGLFGVSTGVYRLHCSGDPLADADGFAHAAQLWADQVKRNPADPDIRRHAANYMKYCAPEKAEALLQESRDTSALAGLYAFAALGVVADEYLNNDPMGSTADARNTPFAQKARQILEQTNDPTMARSAAIALLRTGANLWADNKLDWDYTELGKKLLAVAPLAFDDLERPALPLELPKRGERPPATLRVGGNVQAQSLARKVTPKYPAAARDRGIQGTVKFTALVGLDGTIVALRVDGGAPELTQVSLDAVKQWIYKPTLLNGKPVFILTQIDVNFILGAIPIA